MSTNDLTAGAALLRLDHAVTTAYASLRALGLGTDPVRDAILGQVADTITTAAYNRDGVRLPVDTDDDSGGGVLSR